MVSPPDPKQGSDHDKPGDDTPLSRAIPWRWIVVAILSYMLIHNLILWFNTR